MNFCEGPLIFPRFSVWYRFSLVNAVRFCEGSAFLQTCMKKFSCLYGSVNNEQKEH